MDIKVDQLPLTIKQRIRVNEETGCWIWTGVKTKDGYCVIRLLGTIWRVSKVIHMLFISPIPGELESSHVCPNRACCRPHQDHVIFETHADNLKRPRNNNMKFCRKGHAMIGDNILISNGQSLCRRCRSLARRARQKRLRDQTRFTK